MAGYHVENFGCRASRADGEAIAAQLRERGVEQAEGVRDADVVVLNTCSVTAEADRDARAFVRKVKRGNPAARVVVTGCYAQRAPREVAGLDGVDRVVGNSHKGRVADVAAALIVERQMVADLVPLASLASRVLVDDGFAHADLSAGPEWGLGGRGQTRPNLKVQDGCGNRCSFCVIPQTRGGSRSVGVERVLEAARRFADDGGREMVLSGINLGRWGRDLEPALRLEDLVEAVMMQTSLSRLRISSVEPMDWTERLVELMRVFGADGEARLARHAHLPLQSGSDAVLRRMFRRYRPWHYAAKAWAIREAVPGAAIGADVMVGFPGETDALFEETYRFVDELPFTYLHLFPFSARPGTAAWEMHKEQPVAGEAVQERMGRLRALMAGKNRRFREELRGTEMAVVTLESDAAMREAGKTRCLTDNFVALELRGVEPANRMVRVRVQAVRGEGLTGLYASEHIKTSGVEAERWLPA